MLAIKNSLTVSDTGIILGLVLSVPGPDQWHVLADSRILKAELPR